MGQGGSATLPAPDFTPGASFWKFTVEGVGSGAGSKNGGHEDLKIIPSGLGQNRTKMTLTFQSTC